MFLARACGAPVGRRSTGNCTRHYFTFFSSLFFSVAIFSHRRSARVKKLMQQKLIGGSNNLRIDIIRVGRKSLFLQISQEAEHQCFLSNNLVGRITIFFINYPRSRGTFILQLANLYIMGGCMYVTVWIFSQFHCQCLSTAILKLPLPSESILYSQNVRVSVTLS